MVRNNDVLDSINMKEKQMQIQCNTRKEDLVFAIGMFEEDVISQIKLTKVQKAKLEYFKRNLYFILTEVEKTK